MEDYEITTVLETSKFEVIIPHKKVYTKSENETAQVHIFEINNENDIIKKIKIKEEEFNVFSDGENIIISHEKWSLSGIGKSLIEAERNLYFEAKDIFEHYKKYPSEDLTKEAAEMLGFLLRIV